MIEKPKLGPNPSRDVISTGRTLKKLFTGEMTFGDLLSPEPAPAPIIVPCTKSAGCTEADGHEGGCCFLST